jgi:hypothetical protein
MDEGYRLMTNVYDSDADEEEDEDIGPGSSDYDLSEEHGYEFSDSENQDDSTVIPQWAMVAVTAIVLVALILPGILLIWMYG